MDGRGGCCIARYAGGGAYDTSKMNRIMLKFRPIAPKPATSGSVSGGTSSPEKSDVFVGTGRTKRRYVRDRNNTCSSNNKKNKKKKAVVSLPEEKKVAVTFPFLPEKPDQKEQTEVMGSSSPPPFDLTVDRRNPKPVQNNNNNNIPIWMNSSSSSSSSSVHPTTTSSVHPTTTVVIPQPVRLVGSCVVVGCLTETFMDGGGEGLISRMGGCTDEEKRYNLEMDTCPGFISDGLNRVRWTNEAYRRMVSQDDEEQQPQPEMMVWLVMEKGCLLPPAVECPAFTCRVRLQYTCRKERCSLTVPCDVWRMDGGGFAWRLDVKAALCLGR